MVSDTCVFIGSVYLGTSAIAQNERKRTKKGYEDTNTVVSLLKLAAPEKLNEPRFTIFELQ